MKTKTIGLTLAFCFLAGPLCLAADPLIGTWKLNEAKSKFTPGTGKSTRVVYEARGDQVRITTDGVNADGKPTHGEWIGKLDGKDYSVTGTRMQTCALTERSMTGPWISPARKVERLLSLVALLWPPMAKAALLPRLERPEPGRRLAALGKEAILSRESRAKSSRITLSTTNSKRT